MSKYGEKMNRNKFQVYNRCPVIYESYKQMVIDLLPKTIEDVRMRSYLGLSYDRQDP